MSVTPVILFINALLLVGLAVAGWYNRSSPGARSFTALQFGAAIWVILTIVGLFLPPGSVRIRVWGLAVAMSLIVVTLWVAFIFEYTGRNHWLEPRRFGPVAAPLCIVAGVTAVFPKWPPLVTETHQALAPAGTVVAAAIGPLGSAAGIYLYGLFLVGLLVVARTVLTEERLFVGQVAALILGTLVTVLASMARLTGLVPYEGYPLSQVALGLQSLFWGYAVFSQDLLGRVPAIARFGERTVFDNVDDGLLVTDKNGVVLRANAQSRVLFDTDSVAGTPLSALFSDIDADPDETASQRFCREGRTYHLQGSVMTDWHDDVIGRAYILRDVTELVRRQQRLEVLNRVLRHNLRNEVTVIRGSAKEIQSRGDGEVTELGQRISEHADRLAALGEKARHLQHVSDASPPDEHFDLESFIWALLDPLQEKYPDSTLVVSAQRGEVRVNRPLFTVVVEEVIENALSHAGPETTVDVAVQKTESAVEVTVSDDGPGIPVSELGPVRAGEETPLDHTSGLGLWLVQWGVQSLGGSVSIDSDGSGTTVRLRVPTDVDPRGTDPVQFDTEISFESVTTFDAVGTES